jgi:predicted O-methyltransferase YrrM
MDEIKRVTRKLAGIKYMTEGQAMVLREHIADHDLSDILEIGFFQGKSTAYLAAILNERGTGHVTTIDNTSARRHDPGIEMNLEALGLSHLVTPIFSERSHTWELGKMVSRSVRPQFDLCYFDGGHTWDITGFGFTLVDLLLKPGGWIIFDDLDWTIEKSPSAIANNYSNYRSYSADERATPGVRMVFENLVPARGYTNLFEKAGWGFAQKPVTPAG